MNKCALCSAELKFINTPTFNSGKLSDGGEICTSCFKKVNNIDPRVAFKLKKYSLTDIQELLQRQSHARDFKPPQVDKAKIIATLVTIGLMLWLFFSVKSCFSDSETKNSNTVVKPVGLGQVGRTEYFEITVNKVELNERVRTGNQFANLKAEPGNMYLIFNVTFKNVDNESRMFSEGDILINYNGKDYTFDHPEMVMLEGWGTFLDQINPLTTKSTNLVYKIPSEIIGDIFWRPGRNSNDLIFFLVNKRAEPQSEK